ncbi:MAG: VCBS repeat-containing protein [Vicingaceae bacterium]|nr:VCBS repeat-containing protein [Vicingaceae bacterium]
MKLLLFLSLNFWVIALVAQPIFRELPPSKTNVFFTNLHHDNMMLEEYMYSGGGVGIGDINNDGLPDIYLIGNSVPDKLYLNKGNLVFEDITKSAFETDTSGEHTAVSMVDINADGYLDLYISKRLINETGTQNILYINNKDNTFTNKTIAYGLDIPSETFQTAFFDYDLDGDLDAYMLNSLNNEERLSEQNDSLFFDNEKIQSDFFFENNSGTFINKTKTVGVTSNAYGLAVSVADINNDGYPDCYIANDFLIRDFMYINKKGRGFSEQILTSTNHTAFFSMGTDIADFNNDGDLDILTLDMGYDDHVKAKENMENMSKDEFYNIINSGQHFQYMQNSLQLSNGDGSFSEIAQLAGVAKTDWSWGVLFADFDNDGWKDIVITNGIDRKIRFRDALMNEMDSEAEGYINLFPKDSARNKLFKNNKNLTFTDVSEDWGFNKVYNSSGVAYSDLDNDGDLDLVINNYDKIASIFENTTANRNFLSLELKGEKGNVNAIGARVTIHTKSGIQVQELNPVRGFLSSVDYRLHFGLGNDTIIDKIEIRWPNLKTSTIKNITINQFLKIDFNKTVSNSTTTPSQEPTLFKKIDPIIKFKHTENEYDDFEKEILLPNKYSQLGPTISITNVDKSKTDDLFIGGAKNQKSALFLQNKKGTFTESFNIDILNDSIYEDVGSLFFDADNDGDMDLYVASGGNEVVEGDAMLQDRLYINNGKGLFAKSKNILPKITSSTKIVEAADFDNDGDLDLFVGGRITPGNYPKASTSYLLRNDNGIFTDVTDKYNSKLKEIGMVTGACFEDVNGDKKLDLVIIGEWMPLRVFINNGFGFDLLETNIDSEGLWYSLEAMDVDNDGDIDFIAGNTGKNSKFKASAKKPLNVYGGDLDNNSTNDIVLSTYQDSIHYPVRGKECSTQQMPFISEKFESYSGFAHSTMEEIYGKALDTALHLTARTLYSSIFINNGKGNFSMKKLPLEAQFAPIQSILITDINNDGIKDLILSGNLFETEVETVRYDANPGACLIGNGLGDFKPISVKSSGINCMKNVKSSAILKVGKKDVIIMGINNDKPIFFSSH